MKKNFGNHSPFPVSTRVSPPEHTLQIIQFDFSCVKTVWLRLLLFILALMMLVTNISFAEDYSSMSNDELLTTLYSVQTELQFREISLSSYLRTLIPIEHKNGILLALNADTAFTHAGKYNSGDISHQYSIYDVKPGIKYLITGDVPSSNEKYVVAAFYDGKGDYVSRIERDTEIFTYVDYPVEAPENAEKIVIIKYSASAQDIALKEKYTMAGMVNDLENIKDRLTLIGNQLDEANAMKPGTQLLPTSTVTGSIYNVNDKSTYGDKNTLGHSFYSISGGASYFFTAACASNAKSYPAGAFFDKDGKWLASFGQEAGQIFSEVLITAPADAQICVLNKNNGLDAVVLREALSPQSEEVHHAGYNLNIADAMIRQEKRNPFRFAAMDKGYVTFIFDDLTNDIDLIASIFAEYGYPAGFAAIPSKLSMTAKGLNEANGNYFVGMTMQEVLTQAVEDGGEILVHNSSPTVTIESQYDFEFMYSYFIQAKENLEEAGFSPRGIIRAGGSEAINRSEEIDRWLIGNYEYANMGTLPQYNWDRSNTTSGLDGIKTKIDTAAANHTWVSFRCHGLDAYQSGEAMSDESKLREILTYCQNLDVEVVTCGYIFDHFGSSVLEELIKTQE